MKRIFWSTPVIGQSSRLLFTSACLHAEQLVSDVCIHTLFLASWLVFVQVEVATSKRELRSEGSAKPGLMWHIPLMLGPRKEGSDRHKIQCMVFDFIIHPDTCRMALNNASYKVSLAELLCSRLQTVWMIGCCSFIKTWKLLLIGCCSLNKP